MCGEHVNEFCTADASRLPPFRWDFTVFYVKSVMKLANAQLCARTVSVHLCWIPFCFSMQRVVSGQCDLRWKRPGPTCKDSLWNRYICGNSIERCFNLYIFLKVYKEITLGFSIKVHYEQQLALATSTEEFEELLLKASFDDYTNMRAKRGKKSEKFNENWLAGAKGKIFKLITCFSHGWFLIILKYVVAWKLHFKYYPDRRNFSLSMCSQRVRLSIIILS